MNLFGASSTWRTSSHTARGNNEEYLLVEKANILHGNDTEELKDTHTETNTAWLGARSDGVLLDHFQEFFHPTLLYFRLDDDTNRHSRKQRVYVRPTGLRRTG